MPWKAAKLTTEEDGEVESVYVKANKHEVCPVEILRKSYPTLGDKLRAYRPAGGDDKTSVYEGDLTESRVRQQKAEKQLFKELERGWWEVSLRNQKEREF